MRFTKDHEYVIVNGDAATVGISDHAQAQLGDVVYVELPEVGAKFDKGAAAAVVESVKAASDVFAPVSGEVIAVNNEAANQTGIVNEDAEGRGWLFQLKLTNPKEIDELMDSDAYAAFLKTVD
jgi:glycine cleavage system H protein